MFSSLPSKGPGLFSESYKMGYLLAHESSWAEREKQLLSYFANHYSRGSQTGMLLGPARVVGREHHDSSSPLPHSSPNRVHPPVLLCLQPWLCPHCLSSPMPSSAPSSACSNGGVEVLTDSINGKGGMTEKAWASLHYMLDASINAVLGRCSCSFPTSFFFLREVC